MSLPEKVVKRITSAVEDPERQRILLALLLQPPMAKRGPRLFKWHRPPLQAESNPGLAPGLRALPIRRK